MPCLWYVWYGDRQRRRPEPRDWPLCSLRATRAQSTKVEESPTTPGRAAARQPDLPLLPEFIATECFAQYHDLNYAAYTEQEDALPLR